MNGRAYVIQGDAAALPFAAGFFHSAITSVPYWGLRSYGTKPRIWGGKPDCKHHWPSIEVGSWRTDTCGHCGAWRGEYGSEPTPEMYVAHTVQVFREVGRVLRDDGTLWLNVGDTYNASGGRSPNGIGKAYGRSPGRPGHDRPCRAAAVERSLVSGLKPKDLVGIPWRVAFALQANGWYLRDCIIWHKPNPMPSSVTDRTTTAHEYVFLLTKSARYFYDADAIREPVTSTGGAGFGKQNFSTAGTGAASRKLADPAERNHPLGRNKRSVWTVPTNSFPGAHFATFPPRLVEPCIKAGTSERGCCSGCGTPWKRVVERGNARPDRPQFLRAMELAEAAGLTAEHFAAIRATGTTDAGKNAVTQTGTGRNADRVQQLAGEAKAVLNGYYREFLLTSPLTVGWKACCTCDAGDAVPCRVLDPFSGAATTPGVARDLGRIGYGVELNPTYCGMGRDRLDAGRVLKLPKPEKGRRQSDRATLIIAKAVATANPGLFDVEALA